MAGGTDRRAWRRVALILGLAAGAPLVGRAGLGPRYGGELLVGLSDLPSADPPRVPSLTSERLLGRLVNETLVRPGPEGTVLPVLAQEVVASGEREWTLGLAERAVFHDGRPVDAEATLRSLRRFLRSPSSAAERLAAGLEGGPAFRQRAAEDLPGLSRLDDRRIVLRFSGLTFAPLTPLGSPAAAITSAGDAGAGPFVPTLRGPTSLTLMPFAAHIRGRPYLDRLELVLLETPRALEGEWRNGRLGLAPGRPGPSVLGSTLLLSVNLGLSPFDQAAARARLASGIPRDDLVRHFVPGGQPASSLLPPALTGNAPTATLPAGGVDTLAAAPLAATIVMGVEPAVPPLVSQRVLAYLGELGLRVTVKTLPGAALRASPPGMALRLVLWTPEVAEPGLALREAAGLAMPSPEITAALEEADHEMDAGRRRALLQKIDTSLQARGLLLPLAWVPASFRSQARLHGMRLEPGGEPVLEDAWVEP